MQISDTAKKSECVSAISTLSDIQYLKLGINAEQNNYSVKHGLFWIGCGLMITF